MKSLLVVLVALLLVKDTLCSITFSTTSSSSSFSAKLQTPFSNDDYSSANPGLTYSSNIAGYGYNIESYTVAGAPDPTIGIAPAYNKNGVLLIQAGNYAVNDYLDYTFTGPNDALAVGGYVFLGNSKGEVQTGTLGAYVNGVLVGTITSTAGLTATTATYVTIISDTPITSVSFQAVDPIPALSYVTVYNFIVGKLQSAVLADPHFVGFDGQKYDIIGAPGKVFNLVSQPHVQINGRFTKPCSDSANWSDIISELGVLINGHKVYFNLKDTATVDGLALKAKHIKYPIGDSMNTIEWTWPRMYEIVTPTLNFSVVQDYNVKDIKGTQDCLGAYIDSYYHSIDTNVPVHGLLGQTVHRHEGAERGNEGAGIIEGVYTDYIVTDLFESDFKYNRYEL